MRVKRMMAVAVVGAFLLTGCGSAGKAYNKGIKAYDKKAYEEALEQFETALSLNPNKAEYYIQKGMTLIALQRYDEARESLEHAVLDREMELVRKNNKRANYGIAVTYFHQGDYEAAKDYLKAAQAEEFLPEMNMDIVLYLTETCRLLGENESALGIYDSWLTEETGTAADFYKRGMLHYELSDWKKSISDFEQAIKMDPQVFEFYLGKMNALKAYGKTDEYNRTVKNAAKLENLTSEQNYFLAKELLNADEIKKAEELLVRAAENGTSEANYYLGEISRDRGDLEGAILFYRSYIAGDGAKDGFAYNQLATCLAEKKEYEAALDLVKKGIEFCNSKNEEILLYNEVVLLEKLGEYKTAYDYAVRFSALFPENEELKQELEFLKVLMK